MQRLQPNKPLAGRTTLWLSRLLVFLAAAVAAGAVFAQQAPSPDLEDGKHGSPHTTYRVINLAPGLLASIPDINASGQATFSMQSETGTADAYFYNGSAVQNIGTLGGDEVLAADVNDLGQVTGRSTTASGNQHAFVWSARGGMLDILAPWGAGYSYAAAINNRGVVTGAFMPNGINAFRWSAATGLENLGAFTPGLSGLSWGSALNDAGLIAGTSDTGPIDRHAFVWTRSGGLVDITNLDSQDAMPIAVGPHGEVAGNRLATGGNGLYSGFLWTAATGMVDLGKAGGTAMYVLAMTPNLRMAGFIRRHGDEIQRAMAWTRSGGTRDIGTLGGENSRAYDVNTAGQVVGYAENKSGGWRAFIWSAREGMLDLNRYLRHPPRGLVLDDALAISENGVIVATSNAGLVLLKPDHGRSGGHVVGPVQAPALARAGVPLQASVAFVDEDEVGTRSVNWSWGDGTGNAGAIDGDGSHATHSYAAPGIYPVTATVVDRAGASTAVSHTVVVTAKAGDMAGGAGAVMSPAGALRQAPAQSGKAYFSLIAPVAITAANSTTGRLHFDLPGLRFRSDAVRLQERQGAQQVFVGSGTVRGATGHQFRLSTSAPARGEPGQFALKIWHTDPASKQDVVDYDNAATPSGTKAARMLQGSLVQE